MTQPARNLPQRLAEARRWFDEGLLAGMEAAGERPLTVAQAWVFATLDDAGTTVSELARRMGVTRQSAHQAVHGLIDAGLMEQVPDPSSARARLIRTTAEGRRAHELAQRCIAVMEDVLARRLGEQGAAALRAALETPWGDPPLVAAPPDDEGPK
ncbi:MarR family winged helix-turn-helix transcriptional regulator [Nonomuraea gerenzanensis]|uniref:Transcriptional regulator, MarR family n=1 Tax=Nonomuraea gerenzanensis TaxID=93944 RepID=A0A1M4EBS4_9ACTN|nr:MarR family winged helix-turn-helix transcriptional regulator [Nonomuraea gerenzanensis]UBU18555.1 MarR family winged helix-turn-helix transcriptional regulator [Nonomuraea gerenzanensis]SBO96397.1 Transcriptional regulator, MarR family [Nonomuraea gerenzanensis]